MLYYFHILLTLVGLFTFSYGMPVENGVAVGIIKGIGKNNQISRQGNYPYVVHIETIEAINGKYIFKGCTGVIIGIKIVLTAAHCLHGKVNPIIHVYAGILDIELEEKKAQKIEVKEYQIHENYQPECKVGIQCCYDDNDIAIMWLRKTLVYGPYVQPAKLNANIIKPIGRKGWILGWGRLVGNVQTTMLHKGLVQVIPQGECETHHPLTHITHKVMCVRGVKKSTKSGSGDSGGPLVIGGVVYGICSMTLEKTPCSKEAVDVYTDVARYSNWIRNELDLEKRECQSQSCTIL